MENKDIHFTEKKVDESWKENVSNVSKKETETSQVKQESHPLFNALVTSFAMQTLFHLGQMENPETGKVETNLDAAKETIDLLLMMKQKTKNNLTSDEEKLLNTAIADLQIKFVQHQNQSADLH